MNHYETRFQVAAMLLAARYESICGLTPTAKQAIFDSALQDAQLLIDRNGEFGSDESRVPRGVPVDGR